MVHLRNSRNIPKALVAGAVGGLFASFVMNQFQALWSQAEKALASQPQKEQSAGGGDESATVRTAEAISSKLFQHNLSEPEKKWAGPLVHYAFGTSVGALYGVLSETMPTSRAGCGTAYATAVWFGGDEVAVPALGLSKSPSEAPVSSHVKALASHLVYGLATDLTRRAIMRA